MTTMVTGRIHPTPIFLDDAHPADKAMRKRFARAPASAPRPLPPAGGPARSLPTDKRSWIERHRGAVSLIASVMAHVAIAGATMINWTSRQPDQAPPAAAMVVELAVMPASPSIPPNEMPLGPEQIEAAPKPKPVDKTDFDPPPQVDAALKPNFAMPLKDESKPAEAKVSADEARTTTAPQATPAPVKDRSEAPVEGNNAAPPSNAEQAWEGRILAKLERNKRYPAQAQRAGQEDTVLIRLVIDRSGKLLNATLRNNTGFAMLNEETLALARRASPFPPPPATITGEQVILVVPVEFYIRKRR